MHILERGGTAVDAAVAVAYVLAVTHPSAGNIGGGGFMLVRPPDGPTVAVDFRETAPAALTRARFDAMIAKDGLGPASVGVPGTVAGLELAHQRFGKLPRKDVMARAIALAQKGHRIGPREALTIGWAWKHIKNDAELSRVFADGKKPKRAGARLVRADLARTLSRIAERGAAGFYDGETARDLVRGLGKEGLLVETDLKLYRAIERVPLVARYRGLTVEIMPPPSAGGAALAMILAQLDALQAWKQPRASAEYLHLFLEASRRAQAERRFGVVDPERLSPAESAERLRRFGDARVLLSRAPIDPSRATPSQDVHPLFTQALAESENTTHFSVVDASGMAVSCTTTLSAGFGAKVMPKGTGVILNNAVASFSTMGENLPEAGRRTTSSMAPALLLREGKLVAVLGSPGGDTIPSTVAQVLLNLVDGQMTLDAAVDAPRLHHGFVPDEVRYERRRPPPKSVLDALVARGHTLSKKRIPIGDANDIVIVDGVAYGYADPREGGIAQAAKGQPSKP